MSELDKALERLGAAKAEVRRTSGPYRDAVKEQDAALKLVYQLRNPTPKRMDFPLAG